MWIGIGLAAVVVVLGAIYLIGRWVDYSSPAGTAATRGPLSPRCALSANTRQALGVTNPVRESYTPAPPRSLTECVWRTSKDTGSKSDRFLSYQITTITDVQGTGYASPQDAAQKDFESASQTAGNGRPVRKVTGVGDAAFVVYRDGGEDGSFRVVAKKGPNVVTVDFSGTQKGFFTDTPIPDQEGATDTARVAGELTNALPN